VSHRRKELAVLALAVAAIVVGVVSLVTGNQSFGTGESWIICGVVILIILAVARWRGWEKQ
jgi:peptidoglycan/LPS O-acetylase OafA/YrhL